MESKRRREMWRDPQYGFEEKHAEVIPDFCDKEKDSYDGAGCLAYIAISLVLGFLVSYTNEMGFWRSLLFVGVPVSGGMLLAIKYLRADTMCTLVFFPFISYLIYLYSYPAWFESSTSAIIVALIAGYFIARTLRGLSIFTVPWLIIKVRLIDNPYENIVSLIIFGVLSLTFAWLLLRLIYAVFYKPHEM